MKNWIELTRKTGQACMVNLARVEMVEPSTEGCIVWYGGSTTGMNVLESYSEVTLMIHRADEDEIAMQHTERVGCLELRETIYQQSNDVPVRVERSDCSNALRMQGNVAVPRTCKANVFGVVRSAIALISIGAKCVGCAITNEVRND